MTKFEKYDKILNVNRGGIGMFLFGKEKELKRNLRQLRAELEAVQEVNDPLERIITFFKVTTKWEDTFPELLYGYGRDEFGMNRTPRGMGITEETIFLGDRYGLFTKTIYYWRRSQSSGRETWGFPTLYGQPSEGKSPLWVVSKQASSFVSDSLDYLFDQIDSQL